MLEKLHEIQTLAKQLFVFKILLSLFFSVLAYSESAEIQDSQRALRVFLDCDRCDKDFVRRQIPYVNYVRDRRDAQVHILGLDDYGPAGRAYEFTFYGLLEFEGNEQKLEYFSPRMETDDEERRGLTRVIEIGLAPFVLNTSFGESLSLKYEAPDQGREVSTQAHEDPWNFWVFNGTISASQRGQERRDSIGGWGNFWASRVTDQWRTWFGTSYNFNERNFTFDDGTTLKDVSRRRSFGGGFVKSLGEHWGAGLGARSESSTFLNLQNAHRVAAAVEFNLFPYSESTERQMTFGYFLGQSRYEYEEPTIFGLSDESRMDQGLFIEYDTEQRWGEISLELNGSHFMDDMELYRVSFKGDLDYRIARGLSIGLWANASLVRDQIYLRSGGATDEEVILGRRALDTDFETSFGGRVRYTFGSIYNNVINSRLSDGVFTRLPFNFN